MAHSPQQTSPDTATGPSTSDSPNQASTKAGSESAAGSVTDCPASAGLSIVNNGTVSFAGRKVGTLATDGTEADRLEALQKARRVRGAVLELIASKIGGVTLDEGPLVPADRNVAGGPSVLDDAVAMLASVDAAARLALDAAAKDFVTDAHAHGKFIGHLPGADEVFRAAGPAELIDDGYVDLETTGVDAFITACANSATGPREPAVDAV